MSTKFCAARNTRTFRSFSVGFSTNYQRCIKLSPTYYNSLSFILLTSTSSEAYTEIVLITAPKKLILIFSWRFYWNQKILRKSLVALKLGWRLINRTLRTKTQRFLFSKRHFKIFKTAVGAINRAQKSSLTFKWRLN